MTIPEIKNQLSILAVLSHYGLKPNKNNMLNCPFHEDKTPSMQVYPETGTVYCFSGNCKLHGKSLDQIDFIMHKDNCTKHQAILKAKAMIGHAIVKTLETQPTINYQSIFEKLQVALPRSKKATDYLKSRNLYAIKLEIGCNHRTSINGKAGYQYPKLKNCIVFPLKDKNGKIASLYGRSFNGTGKHYYTTGRKGLYPGHPNKETKIIVLTESIIDATTVNQHTEYQALALYGANGLRDEHSEALSRLKELQEIILFFDGDKAGAEAEKKYGQQLHELNPTATISKVNTPENQDPNSLVVSHDPNILNHLIENRTKLFHSRNLFSSKGAYEPSISSSEKPSNEKKCPTGDDSKEQARQIPSLRIEEHYSVYKDQHIRVELMGKIEAKDLSRLKVTAVVYSSQYPSGAPSRNNFDLYNDDQTDKVIRKIATKIEVGTNSIRLAFDQITKDLEKYRLSRQEQNPTTKKERYPLRVVSLQEQEQAKKILKSKNLKEILITMLRQTGIVGEQKTALFLFNILLSHKMLKTLHAMLEGTSGSGKSHLIKKIADCMYDQNKIKRFTRVTDKSFYNYGERELQHTGIILEDYDGLTEDAELAWREIQSSGHLSSSVSLKDEQTGKIFSGEKHVFGPIASLVATTQFKVYDDNESRVFVIAIDESEAQTEKVLDYMAKKSAKIITEEQELLAIRQIQNMVYMLKAYKVKNPYRLHLPKRIKQRRRLTQMLHDYIQQITLLHQYQRKKISSNATQMLMTELEDLEIAIDLMFYSIVLKADELDGILRQFYEELKNHVATKGKDHEFTQREIRQSFRISKTQAQRYFKDLEELEYIHRSKLGKGNSYQYRISYWDNIEKLRQELRTSLYDQIEQYKRKND